MVTSIAFRSMTLVSNISAAWYAVSDKHTQPSDHTKKTHILDPSSNPWIMDSVDPPLSIDQVLLTIQGALSVDNATRTSAESSLRAWEADASPGFLLSLLRIVEQQGIDAVGADF
jgi:hypothetical protein